MGKIAVFITGLALGLAAVVNPVQAAPVPYDGLFDEATDTASGDYSELGGPADVGQFTLLGGTNLFRGSINTTGAVDPSDSFNIILDPGYALTSVSLDWDLVADPFNPVAISQNTQLLVTEISGPGTILIDIDVPGSGAAGTYTAPGGLPLGSGEYAVFVMSEVVALYNGGAPRYQISFGVQAPAPPAIPVPGALLLGSVGAGLVGWLRRREAL